ncbi:MOSC domain-containing protein [Microbacterium sp. LWH3-1.2]|uniref:MOSC domain-containing protein n=1 Tax=Microbacterium sp. LWH3-1.2 TaxID=3135256 RepID=UPI003441B3AB
MSDTLATAATVSVGKVQRIFRYPVKSMTGEELTECELDEKGLVGDHLWAVFETATGKIANSKNPRKWAKMLTLRAAYVEEPRVGGEIPPIAITFPDGRVVRSDDDGIDQALSAALGIDVHLSTMENVPSTKAEMIWHEMLGDNAFRQMGSTNEHGEHQIDFDLYGAEGRSYDLGNLHLMTTSSLDHMKSINPDATYDPRRYRPNFLLETTEPGFIESDWVGKSIHLGETTSTVIMNTVRCIMTTLPREDLPLDRATLRGLVKHNTRVVEPFGDWACLGIYSNITKPGKISIGSDVSVSVELAPALDLGF